MGPHIVAMEPRPCGSEKQQDTDSGDHPKKSPFFLGLCHFCQRDISDMDILYINIYFFNIIISIIISIIIIYDILYIILYCSILYRFMLYMFFSVATAKIYRHGK